MNIQGQNNVLTMAHSHLHLKIKVAFLIDLDLFYGKVKFCNIGFCIGKKVKTVDFSETIVACDLKVGRCRQLIE